MAWSKTLRVSPRLIPGLESLSWKLLLRSYHVDHQILSRIHEDRLVSPPLKFLTQIVHIGRTDDQNMLFRRDAICIVIYCFLIAIERKAVLHIAPDLINSNSPIG